MLLKNQNRDKSRCKRLGSCYTLGSRGRVNESLKALDYHMHGLIEGWDPSAKLSHQPSVCTRINV